MIPWLEDIGSFPPVTTALADPDGLLAAGGDLSPPRLLDAYIRGIFPWFSAGQPILWWSPDPRMVLFTAKFAPSRSLAKTLRGHRFEVRFDTAFRAVMSACAAPRDAEGGTWITPDIIDAYTRLHALGIAHSVEAWADGELAGGLYGVAIGRMFYGESMFARRTDASKVALAALAGFLRRHDFPLIDCQMSTPHLASLGAREVSRTVFCGEVERLVQQPPLPGPWHPDD